MFIRLPTEISSPERQQPAKYAHEENSTINLRAVWPDGYIIFQDLAICNNENYTNNVTNLPK